MPTVEELRIIHTNPIVRQVWSHLRLFYSAGCTDPQNERLLRDGIEALKKMGVPIPENDTWWRDAAYPMVDH